MAFRRYISLILILGFLLNPALIHPCTLNSQKATRSCCKKSSKGSAQCCKNHAKSSNKKCDGNCKGSSCNCPSFQVCFVIPDPFGFFEVSSFSVMDDTHAFHLDQFHHSDHSSLWVLPKISWFFPLTAIALSNLEADSSFHSIIIT